MDNLQQSNVVQKICCKQCNKTDIGQTGRLLRTRRNEHRNNINLNEKYHNVISKHILEFNHDFNSDNVKILHRETNHFKRCFVETSYKQKEEENCFNIMTDLKNYDISYNVILDKILIVYYVPRRIMRFITRRATMLAGD